MFEVPHMLAGAAIGKIWPRARYALPAAFLSHLVLDALPHREVTEIPGLTPATRDVLGAVAIVAALALVAILSWKRPQRWVMLGAAFCAILPDLLDHVGPKAYQVWFDRSLLTAWFSHFHSWIQTGSRGYPLVPGLAGQVVVIALALWIILRKDASRETRVASREPHPSLPAQADEPR